MITPLEVVSITTSSSRAAKIVSAVKGSSASTNGLTEPRLRTSEVAVVVVAEAGLCPGTSVGAGRVCRMKYAYR